MACCKEFVSMARDAMRTGDCEVGLHLHAWNSPPIVPRTPDDFAYHPYLTEYSDELIKHKLSLLTNLLEDEFSVKMVSHRAGRWAFNSVYAKCLVELGYQADCSVTPHVSWANNLGAPDGIGGPDYRGFPDEAYRLDLDHIDRAGESGLVEVPPTIVRSGLNRLLPMAYTVPGVRRFAWQHRPPVTWLYPNGKNLALMIEALHAELRVGKEYVEFVLHSSELMPGGSPLFPDQRSIERLYADLETLFSEIATSCVGMTLHGYTQDWARRHANNGQATACAA
jgi:hypothetical protein